MSNDIAPEVKEQVKLALKCYANFYKALVSDSSLEAEEHLKNLQAVDETVKQAYGAEYFQGYLSKREKLMRIFQGELIKGLRGEIQDGLMKQAESLINKLEISSSYK